MNAPTFTGRTLAWAVPMLAEAAALGRSVAFAWWIGPDELGRAMMLALTARLVEMASDLGADRLILQASDGNSARFAADMHGAMVLRGLFGAVLLIGLAPFLGVLFEGGPAVTSYALLALIPVMRGLANLDFRRSERGFRYLPMAIVEAGATLAMAFSILPASFVLGDHRAMIVVLVAHAAAFLVLSHIVASRGYRMRFTGAALIRIWRFGAPLILNAILLFLTFYADRLIVAQSYGWALFALYGVAVQLALLPAQIVGRAAASLVLPQLREALRHGTLARTWSAVFFSHVILGLGMTVGFALAAPTAIELVYGAGFRPDPALAILVGLAAGFRIIRTPLSQLAIATGRTGDPARANLVRSLAIVPALACAGMGLPLFTIAAAAALGEVGATWRSILLARPNLGTSNVRETFA